MEYDEIFEMFKSSYVGKEIKKDVILEKLTDSEDKEIVERFANSFYIKYSVKAENINKKAEENFEEIQIIEIDINDFRAIYDIYGILLSIIPYPILALFNYNNRISFAVSNRILAEEKNNKGKIYTSYLIKKEDIAKYLKIDIDSCYSMIEIYNKWIENIEDVVAYCERLDSVMETIEIGFHIKSDEVLEKLETYIARDCGTYNMKPKDGWKSKLEKYEDNISLQKKVETHILWEYLSENTFLKNRLEDFTNWNDFKKTCAYNNNSNDIYYSQYNSRMSADEGINDTDSYMQEYGNRKRYNVKSIKKQKVEQIKCNVDDEQVEDTMIDEINQEINEKFELAIKYYKGIDIEPNHKKAFEIFNELIEKYNFWYAKTYIGAMYYWGDYLKQNYKKAYEIFSELVEKYNDIESKLYLADMYRIGRYVEKNYEKAFKMYEEMGEKENSTEARFYMATMYYYGQYVEQDYKKAFEMFSELTENNNIDSKYFVAKMYYYGQYVEKDEEKAYKIFSELVEKYNYELAKTFTNEFKDGIYNNLVIEFKYIYRSDLFGRRNIYINFLENQKIDVLEQDKYDISILVEMTNKMCKELEVGEDYEGGFLGCNMLIDELTHVFDVYDSNTDYDYLVNLRLNIDNASKESLNRFDDYMRTFKQEYRIYRFDGIGENTIIEFNRENLEKNEEGMPLSMYMNEYIKKEDDNIIFRIDDIQPHVILYISNLISLLNKNNNTTNRDYIVIKPGRSSLYDIFDYVIENDSKYIFKYHVEIKKIPTEVLKQLEDFLQGFNVKYFIERRLDNNVIINFYPRSQEVISFIIDVLEINKLSYDVGYAEDIYRYFDGNCLWIFEPSKKDKENICELLKKTDERRYNYLKELGAPEIILKSELAPLNCDYGIISSKEFQNQIENILQPLKVEYSILDSEENIIQEYKI